MAARKCCGLVIALFLLSLFAGVAGAQNAGSVESLQVKFKLDVATTRGLNMGDVWAAPAKFTGAQNARSFVVEARAVGLVSEGNPVDVEATWKSADPAAVKVNPETGKKVKLAVLKPGQWTVLVSYGNLTKKLDIKASFASGIFQVEINQ
jgi:hypothetical protein